MFACCGAEDSDQVMDLTESAEAVSVLLHLLHNPPQAHDRWKSYRPIPLPTLRIAFDLLDKYMLAPGLAETLHTHLAAHVRTSPLQVYGYAVELGLDNLASQASEHLLHPPVASYTLDEIRVIPSAAALHRLVVLQARREPELREVLLNEPLFPHGYSCYGSHGKRLDALWEARKARLVPKVRAGKMSYCMRGVSVPSRRV